MKTLNTQRKNKVSQALFKFCGKLCASLTCSDVDCFVSLELDTGHHCERKK